MREIVGARNRTRDLLAACGYNLKLLLVTWFFRHFEFLWVFEC